MKPRQYIFERGMGKGFLLRKLFPKKQKMKKLSDFKGTEGIVIAAQVLGVIMTMLAKEENRALEGESSPLKMFSGFMQNSPAEMKEIFAILSERDVKEYDCDGAEAMLNMLILANDPVVIGLFTSRGQKTEKNASASAKANTEASAT